jgi:hypothetical protein
MLAGDLVAVLDAVEAEMKQAPNTMLSVTGNH